jgi:hypothetical protein
MNVFIRHFNIRGEPYGSDSERQLMAVMFSIRDAFFEDRPV